MDRNEQTLSLIGLCLRGRNLEVGEEPVEAVARARDARVLLLASDAADNTARRVRRFAEMGQCVWLRVPFTKRELGLATGRASAAVAAITDIGLAVAVVRRLAEAEPEKYDEDLAKLELKAKRAAERKSEAAQHEKNLRRGVKRPKKQTETPEERKQDRRAGAKAERGPRKGEKTGKGGPRGKTSARPVPGEKNQWRSGTYEKSAGGKTQGRTASGKAAEGRSGLRKSGPRPFKSDRPKAKRNPFAHSRPVKKGKGSFRKKES